VGQWDSLGNDIGRGGAGVGSGTLSVMRGGAVGRDGAVGLPEEGVSWGEQLGGVQQQLPNPT
jgi:hypothetical protein